MGWTQLFILRVAAVFFGGVAVARFFFIPAIVAQREALDLYNWNEQHWVNGLTEISAVVTGILVVMAIMTVLWLFTGPHRFSAFVVLMMFLGYFVYAALLANGSTGSYWERFCEFILMPIGIVAAIVLILSSTISGIISGLSGK